MAHSLMSVLVTCRYWLFGRENICIMRRLLTVRPTLIEYRKPFDPLRIMKPWFPDICIDLLDVEACTQRGASAENSVGS